MKSSLVGAFASHAPFKPCPGPANLTQLVSARGSVQALLLSAHIVELWFFFPEEPKTKAFLFSHLFA